MKITELLENFADGKKPSPEVLAAEFVKSKYYKREHDCKNSTFQFLKWFKETYPKLPEPDVMLLAPPNPEIVKQHPELKGKSGEGDAHIFVVVDNVGIDFTADQFPGVSNYLKITPFSNIKLEYSKIGKYFTDSPDYFNKKPFIRAKWSNLPSWMANLAENFADGKKPGRKGLAKRSGVNTKASVSSLRKTAKSSSGEKQRMAHWLANMKAGRAKKNK